LGVLRLISRPGEFRSARASATRAELPRIGFTARSSQIISFTTLRSVCDLAMICWGLNPAQRLR
jgi:hypothetical protein